LLDFTQKETQIEFNSKRLKEEYDRYFEIKSRIGIISIIYSIFAMFSVQLIQFMLTHVKTNYVYNVSLFIYLALFIISLLFSILLLIPKAIAYKNKPVYYYKTLMQHYIDNPDIPNGHEKFYVRESYNEELERIIELNFKLNNQKSKFHYWAFTLALIALIPYFLCVGIKVTKSPNDIKDVKLINECFNINEKVELKNKVKEDNIMFKEEENNQSEQESTPNEEPKINPDLVIHPNPVMVKENKQTPETREKVLTETAKPEKNTESQGS